MDDGFIKLNDILIFNKVKNICMINLYMDFVINLNLKVKIS